MAYRAIGPFNGTLPVPTGMAIAFVRNHKAFPFLNYMQMIPAPETVFMYFRLHPDDPIRLKALNSAAWAYDDYAPTGRGSSLNGEWIESRVNRWAFGWELGEETIRVWKKNAFDPKMLYDEVTIHKANLHRAQRCVNAITDATYEQTSSLQGLIGAGSFWDKSSGEEFDGGGTDNPNFQIIKKTFLKINRRLHLATNGVATMDNMVAVITPEVAEKLAYCGEIVNLLKQSQYAKEVESVQYARWGLPETLYGVKIVVEDSPRVFINLEADGTSIADATVASERDYILTGDTVYFGIRPGGLDGGIGMKSFATWQLYHFRGEVQVKAFSDPENELIKGRVVMEDKALAVATVAGYKLTNVLA